MESLYEHIEGTSISHFMIEVQIMVTNRYNIKCNVQNKRQGITSYENLGRQVDTIVNYYYGSPTPLDILLSSD